MSDILDLDLNNESTISTIIGEIDTTEEIDRKTRAFNAYQVFSGNVGHYTLNGMTGIGGRAVSGVRDIRPMSWKSYTISDISISNMVISKLSKSYQSAPSRELESDDQTEVLNDLYQEIGADRQFKEFDESFNLHRHGLFWVNWREQDQAFQFLSLSPYEYSVIRDKDTGELQMVILQYPDTSITSEAGTGDGFPAILAENQADSAGASQVYAFWTKTQHVVVRITDTSFMQGGQKVTKRNVTYVPLKDNPDNVNPLGNMLPFVYVSMDNSPDYPTENPITEQTVTFNTMWSELLTSANIQGSGSFVLSYPQSMEGQFDTLNTGLTQAIHLPQSTEPGDPSTEANFISPTPDLAGQRDSYEAYLRLALANHGITTSQAVSGGVESFSSGLERMIAQADVQNKVDMNQQMFYTRLEKDVFAILKRWDEVLGTRMFDDKASLSVRYPRPKVMVSDRETLENIQKRLELGLIEKWEALQMLDPNLGEQEAKDKLAKIDQERQGAAISFINPENTDGTD